MTGLLRVRSSRRPYRRAGIAFGDLPLVLGPEHFAEGIEGLRQVAAIVADPVLKVQLSDPDTPDVFRPIGDGEREAIIAAAAAAADHDDPEAAEEAARVILAGLVGEVEAADPDDDGRAQRLAARMAAEPSATKLQSPVEPEANDGGAAASPAAAEGKADGGADAALAVDTPPAPDASAASGEQSRAGADASAAAPAADASAGKQPGDTQQPLVADGTERPASPAGDAANPAAAAPAAPADTEPKKGDAVPAKPAKAKAVAKPRNSSGRKPAAPPPPAKG